MRLNLGCGLDLREGYVNVDFVVPRIATLNPSIKFDQQDLSRLPWIWADNSVDEILMLDFLEHFPYRMTDSILQECWRVLGPGGTLDVQVPDLRHSAHAFLNYRLLEFQCNRCGWLFQSGREHIESCQKCGQTMQAIQDAAIHRLYGGQDRPGNWHFTAFTEDVLRRHLEKNGFGNIQLVEKEYQLENWNLKLRASKAELPWDEGSNK